jgi:hypothetical protein
MTPSLLRQIWTLVEKNQANLLLQLDDTSLAELLLRQIHHEQRLNHTEADLIQNYIYKKLPLIRDLAQSRLANSTGSPALYPIGSTSG